MTLSELEEVVSTNSKQRFSLSEDRRYVRASQGHSIAVDLGYAPAEPPGEFFHGTARSKLESILENGLQRMGRHHVHLSIDEQTARAVGARHGKPAVLRVDSGAMHREGHAFLRTENGVWLTERVPARFLDLDEES